MQINPSEIYEKLVKLGTEWAECKYAADLLEDARKPILAKLGSQSNASSQNAREAFALSHADYEEHCKKLATALKAEAIAKVKYSSAITYADLMRTVAATERAANKV
jgi:hypothetical protein